ncbi:MAG: hypothetical protein R3321_12235, partial [Nitrososphaeraceae archaeon]|nr:hypothetical protein [Nitrososphaeraceae archaeon]
YKSEIPETGLGINIARNLSFQFASFGIKWRIGAEIYRSNENQKTIKNEEYHTELIITFFERYLNPYLGLSFGVGNYSVYNFNKFIFFLGSIGGIKFPIINWLHPFLEIYSNYYFSDFNIDQTLKEISSFQITAKAGIIIRF